MFMGFSPNSSVTIIITQVSVPDNVHFPEKNAEKEACFLVHHRILCFTFLANTKKAGDTPRLFRFFALDLWQDVAR
jgi:hypothetical protein